MGMYPYEKVSNNTEFLLELKRGFKQSGRK